MRYETRWQEGPRHSHHHGLFARQNEGSGALMRALGASDPSGFSEGAETKACTDPDSGIS
jgi:hypothetical protein